MVTRHPLAKVTKGQWREEERPHLRASGCSGVWSRWDTAGMDHAPMRLDRHGFAADLRLPTGWSWADIADAAGVSPSVLDRARKAKALDLESYLGLCVAFGIPLTRHLTGAAPSSEPVVVFGYELDEAGRHAELVAGRDGSRERVVEIRPVDDGVDWPALVAAVPWDDDGIVRLMRFERQDDRGRPVDVQWRTWEITETPRVHVEPDRVFGRVLTPADASEVILTAHAAAVATAAGADGSGKARRRRPRRHRTG